jgi:hypothetical protein
MLNTEALRKASRNRHVSHPIFRIPRESTVAAGTPGRTARFASFSPDMQSVLSHRCTSKDSPYSCDAFYSDHDVCICEFEATTNSLNVDLSFQPITDLRVASEVGGRYLGSSMPAADRSTPMPYIRAQCPRVSKVSRRERCPSHWRAWPRSGVR